MQWRRVKNDGCGDEKSRKKKDYEELRNFIDKEVSILTSDSTQVAT